MSEPLIDLQFVRRLDRLKLQNRRTLAGQLKGERRSRKKGLGLDFADYRHYTPGDDLRFIDWNLYARLDRLFVKIFHEEQDLQCHLLLDCSRSMDWGEPGKFVFARRLAAAIAYVGLIGQDKVTLSCFSSAAACEFGPARGRHYVPRLTAFLEGLAADGRTSLETICRAVSQRVRTRSIIILLSDLLDPLGFESALRHLARDRFEVYVLHVLAPQELDPVLTGHLELHDAETDEKVEITVNARLRQIYLQHLDGFCAQLQAFCTRHDMAYLLLRSDLPPEELILKRLRRAGLLSGK